MAAIAVSSVSGTSFEPKSPSAYAPSVESVSNTVDDSQQNSPTWKALLVLTEPPLPFGGAASRWNYVLACELIRRGAELTILCCSGGEDRDGEASAILGKTAELNFFAPCQRKGVARLASLVRPVSHLFSAAMRNHLYTLDLDAFELIQFETHFTGWLIDKPIDHAVLNVHSLFAIDHQDSEAAFRDRITSMILLRAERKMLRRFRRLTALTPRLTSQLNELVPRKPVATCPMSVDLSLYEFRERPRSGSARIGIIGSFHWHPTQSACKTLVNSIWPQVAAKSSEARLVIVGRQADAFCDHLELPEDAKIESDVPDTRPYFWELDAMVYLPTVGSGMKVKVIESIAYGTPVVTNVEGGEGLPESIASVICVESESEAVERIMWLISHRSEAFEESKRLRSILAKELSAESCVDSTLAFAKAGRES